MSWFWIIGIVANVTLTVAAIVWVIRQGKPKHGPPQDATEDGGETNVPKDPPSPS
jgi:hypothetical protein